MKLLALLLPLTVVVENVFAKTAVATFYNDGVNGTITLEQASEGSDVTVKVDLSGLNNEAAGYHIHVYPVNSGGSGYILNSAYDGCGGAITAGHYDPLAVKPGNANYASNCSSDINLCEPGDLSGRYGPLSGNDVETDETRPSAGLNLFGQYSVIGRSIVIHKSAGGARWVCATLLEEGIELKSVVATFEGTVSGTITMLQDASDPDAETTVRVNLAGEGTTAHKWHVHELRVGSDCASTGGHYNPLNVDLTQPGYSNSCNETNHENCEVGDMYEKHGELALSESGSQYLFTDSNLPLSGNYSVSGRSIVIHSAGLLGTRYVCASLGRSATAAFDDDGISGSIKFYQGAEDDSVTIDISLDGLDNRAGKYHVHQYSVLDGCGGASTGGHYNPLNVVGGEGNQGTGLNYLCATNNQVACEAGDLSGKFGNLNGNDYSATFEDKGTGLNLYGPNSIVGRSIVIHEDGAPFPRLICATIESDFSVTKIKADIGSPLSGFVQMSQTTVDAGADTTVEVRLESSGSSEDHKWHVHQTKVDATNACSSTGGHYNPELVNGGAGALTGDTGRAYLCAAEGSDYCEVGDMSGKFGALDAPSNNFYTDMKLPLSGLNSVFDRSVVIHAANFSGTRLACGSFEEVVDSVTQPEPDEEPVESTNALFWGIAGGVFGTLTVVALALKFVPACQTSNTGGVEVTVNDI